MGKAREFRDAVEQFTEKVRQLLQDDLGCNCGKEVLDQIRILKGEATPGRTDLGLIVGERVLIGFVDAAAITPIQENAGRLVLSGATFRDSLMLKRFRLVVEGKVSKEDRKILESEASKYELVSVHFFE
jgi:hypothetical protein